MSRKEPRPYQSAAVAAAYPHDGYGLFMQQRTGKTLTALWLAEAWNCTDNLIICPKKGIPVWEAEIRAQGLDSSHWQVYSFETFRIRHKEFIFKKWDLVIVDESHRIKERSSQQTKAIWKLSKLARKRLILTGSPQGNGMEDYYAQLRFIRPDVFPTWKSFCDNYLTIEDVTLPGREDPFPKIVGYRNQDQFKAILATMSYRVTRDEVSSVKTRVKSRRLEIAPSEAFLGPYREMDKELMTEVQDNLITAPMVLVKASKLHQLCGGFIKSDGGEVLTANQDKLSYFWELVDGELKGQSFVVIANYKAEMDTIAQGLSDRGISNVQIRGGKKHQYNPDDRSQVTILNPSAGEAINLAHYSVMVVFSMNYSFLKWEQFKDRIVLVDTPEVRYYYLLMKGTIDETVYSAVVNKKKLSSAILDMYKQRQEEQTGQEESL